MVSGNRTESEPFARRIALAVQYDGSAFIGWQIQPEGRSVQSDLQAALKILLGHDAPVVASGRTDTGVHALGQIIHFSTNARHPLERICIGLNGIMSRDVSVINAYDVPSDFNARFSAVEREYRYLIYNAPCRSPFMLYRAAWVSRPLDVEFMNEAFSYLLGEHDFSSFCRMSSAVNQNTVRTVHEAHAVRNHDMIEVTIRGNAFLHNMVRSIIGTTLELSRRSKPSYTMKDILEGKDRRSAGETAPAYGLYLKRVRYNPSLDTMPSAYPDKNGDPCSDSECGAGILIV